MVPDIGASHLSDEQLERYRDGELAASDVVHLESCEDCAGRLRDIDDAMAAYLEYREMVRAMHPATPPRPWAPLDVLIAGEAERGRSKILRWWQRLAVAAAACAVAVALVWRHNAEQPSRRASELLTRSVSAALPRSRDIALRVGGRTFVRPAVLTTDATTPEPDVAAEHLRSLFVAAHYSWRDPLSARSFQEWRSGLRQKRDSVSVIRKQGREESYRVRTDSPAGVLSSVSITLRAADLYPMNASFAFMGEDPLDVSDAPAATAESAPTAPRLQREATAEVLASPEDTLHVLAALDAIDADVEDPIEISEEPDHHHLIVRGSGITLERRKLIAEALKPLPRVALQLNSGTSPASASPTAAPSPAEHTASEIPPDFRRQLEERFGGPMALQQITDRVLDASASILARAHALETLASKFPPEIARKMPGRDRDLLGKLHQHHSEELQKLFSRMRSDLQPLLVATASAQVRPAADWQSAVPELMGAARSADDLLNRLLAGSYTQASGSQMLREVSPAIERLGAAIQAQGRE